MDPHTQSSPAVGFGFSPRVLLVEMVLPSGRLGHLTGLPSKALLPKPAPSTEKTGWTSSPETTTVALPAAGRPAPPSDVAQSVNSHHLSALSSVSAVREELAVRFLIRRTTRFF